MLAYSSLNHVSYIALAIFLLPLCLGDLALLSGAFNGAVLQIFNHGIGAAALFAMAGILFQKTGTDNIRDMGGIGSIAPALYGFAGIAAFASLGLPGLNGFPGEFLIFKTTFAVAPALALVALPALFLTAAYLLNFIQTTFHGPEKGFYAGGDLTAREKLCLFPLALLIIGIGIFPSLITGWLLPAIESVSQLQRTFFGVLG